MEKLNMIRVFVGTPANNEDLESQAVLEWSIRKHASAAGELHLDETFQRSQQLLVLEQRQGLAHAWLGHTILRTALGIPAFCNFQGKAIYLDIDMIVMADIAQLWNVPINGNAFVVAKDKNTFCCSLFDCARAKKWCRRSIGSRTNMRCMLGYGAISISIMCNRFLINRTGIAWMANDMPISTIRKSRSCIAPRSRPSRR